jgi:2,3-dihydroxybenzoate decarboxylase
VPLEKRHRRFFRLALRFEDSHTSARILRTAMKKIALEEAFTTPGLEKYLERTLAPVTEPGPRATLKAALEDLSERRLAVMDEAGIDLFVLSQTSPGVQVETDTATAIRLARSANDYLQKQIELHPTRYRGFAHLAMQDPAAAAGELQRCVRDYQFLGALINGNTNGIYLDDPRNHPFWERVVELDVPVYIHPADPYVQPRVIEGYPEMQGAVWGWSTDNSTHFLRMLFSGLFDRYPQLTIVLGHMGETLPYFAWRIDSRYANMEQAHQRKIKKKPSEYFRSNLIVTTTGVCQDSALLCALAEMGDDRILFSADYPYEDPKEAAEWIDRAPITEDQRRKICYANAERVLKL